MRVRYVICLRWSDRDQAYLARVPELPGCHTHGETYQEALENALEVIELWIEAAEKDGWLISSPRVIA